MLSTAKAIENLESTAPRCMYALVITKILDERFCNLEAGDG